VAEDVEPQHRSGGFSRRRRHAAVLGAAAAVLAVGVPVALAGRQSSGRHSSGLPAAEAQAIPSLPPGASLPPAAELPPRAVEQSAGVPLGTPVPGQVKGRPDDDGCPVTAPRLLDALRASDRYRHLAATGGLADVDCYDSYALARTRPDGADPATVVFHYSQLTETWQAIACAEVPEAVRAHLRRCA
jgi:hypothetical protein